MERFAFSARPVCPNVVYQKDGLRISLLTSRLLRVEQGSVTGLATQTVWNRDLDKVDYSLETQGDWCILKTEAARFKIDLVSADVVSVTLPNGRTVTDFKRDNLLGTARTLDMANGAVKLEPGILSRSGVGMMDDSRSLLLDDRGRILPRPACTDRYYFAYGKDYREQLKDFFRLTGPVPLIPKFALGNWWSRYKAYTQEEYRDLMQTFIDKKLPVTVATIDMDWHWTDVLDRFGQEAKPEPPRTKEEILYNTMLPGWTGYSWNTELFPDHRELLDWLHEQGFHVTLNVHPSQGIRFFEDCYGRVCEAMGRNAEEKKAVSFDIADEKFVQAYFDILHHPMEEEGVDFWWLDWQQGRKTKIPGLDPLWALNHYHTLDMDRKGKRSLILSRYAGLGSHRYPLGFSGDTIVTWKSLAFQPYFTVNAANAGYTWWSHDIGGHMQGIQDDELYLRWLQFGVFSPINRLHSSNSDFMGKEPWKRSWAVEKIAGNFLRLRHKLIPYLYSANYRTHAEGEPLCMPLYYRYDREDAYHAPNEYLFGGQLLVCPVTAKEDPRLNLAATKLWLPEGRWTDFFNDRIYQGGRWVTLYRDLDSIPVLAGEGSIVPMYRSGNTNDLSLAQPLELHIWRGNGSFDLYEDDGETDAYKSGLSATTGFRVEETETGLRFRILPPVDSHGLLPEKRQMYLKFRDVRWAEMTVNGESVPFDREICVEVGKTPVTVELGKVQALGNPPREELRAALLTRVQGGNGWKSAMFKKDRMPGFVRGALEELDAMAP